MSSPPWLIRGFTGHEQLNAFALINMNGRVYDPVLGRFNSANNQVQAPGYSQSFNRYTYADNNPLKYTDPTGYSGTTASGGTNWNGGGGNGIGPAIIPINGDDFIGGGGYSYTGNSLMGGSDIDAGASPGTFTPTGGDPTEGQTITVTGNVGQSAYVDDGFRPPVYPITQAQSSPQLVDETDNTMGGAMGQGASMNYAMQSSSNPWSGFSTFDEGIPASSPSSVNSPGSINWSAVNTGLQVADFVGNGAAASREILMEYRASAPLMETVGMSGNLKAISYLGLTSKYLGPVGIAGSGLSVALDMAAYQNGQLSGARFSYNTIGTALGVGVGIAFGGIYGATVAGSFWSGQQIYDATIFSINKISEEATNFQNAVNQGWLPK